MYRPETKAEIKTTGATFTPTGLADLLAEKILQAAPKKELAVLDPACGDGALLDAIASRLTTERRRFTLAGFDTNERYLDVTRERLSSYLDSNIDLVHGDFLELTSLPTEDADNHLLATLNGEYNVDVVIANPPYVRTQILGSEEAQRLAKKFGLKGRVDLYYPFLMAMTARLKEGGVLGVITSNRYLSTKSGESIRKFLSENYELLEVIDLGDTKLFDAAVLPAIFIGRKKRQGTERSSTAKFIKVYEELTNYQDSAKTRDNIYEVLRDEEEGRFSVTDRRYNKTIGKLNYTAHNKPWEMLNESESSWTSRIDSKAHFRIGERFKVRVGIKTTADKIFISDEWDDEVNKPEDDLLKPLISQENIDRWSIRDNSKLRVLYPHYSDGGKKKTISLDKYPQASKYFIQHVEKLKSRKYVIEAGREWYEIWVPHNPASWSKPKLVFPDISNTPRFFYDDIGRLVNGNCYWIVAESQEEVETLLLIQGVANSKLMTKYHDLVFNNKLYSGRRRYFTQFVERYPMPDPTSEIGQRIISIVKRLNCSSNPNSTSKMEDELEDAVMTAFSITEL